MFPERYIADEFWAFVRDLALDLRNGSDDPPEPDELQRRTSRTLDDLEERRFELRVQFTGPGALVDPPGEAEGIWRHNSDRQCPWGFLTLQEALVGFLINSAALAKLSFDYEIWLRTVPLVLADAIHDPDWLRIILRDVDYLLAAQRQLDDPAGQREYTMAISDDWSCLRRETFDYIVREYTGKG